MLSGEEGLVYHVRVPSLRRPLAMPEDAGKALLHAGIGCGRCRSGDCQGHGVRGESMHFHVVTVTAYSMWAAHMEVPALPVTCE